jgi:PAS domain S-box-containing protein
LEVRVVALSGGQAIPSSGRPLLQGAARTRLLVIGAFLLFAGMAGLAAYMSWDARRVALTHALQSSENLLAAFEADIERNITTYDLSLQNVVDVLKDPDIRTLSDHNRRLVLFDRAATARYLGAILIVDAQGRVTLDSLREVPSQQNVAQREYFQAHRDRRDLGLFISHPFLSNISGKWEIGLSRRLENPDGSFAGVVVGTMQLDFFRQLFERVDTGQGGSITFFTEDGSIIMRKPYDEQEIGRDMLRSSAFSQYYPASPSGSFAVTSALDNVTRLYVYRHFRELPLVIGSGVPTRLVFADWWQKTLIVGIATVGLAGVAGLLGLICFAELRRRGGAERAATESEHRYRLLADNSTDMIVRAGLDGVRKYVSPACRTLYGYEPEELLGTSAHEFIHPDDREILRHAAAEARAGKGNLTNSYRFRHKDGTCIWVEVTRNLIPESAGSAAEIVLVVRDISARKEAELALQRSEWQAREQARVLALMQEVSAQANQANDLDSAVTYCLSRLCAHLGWPVGLVHIRNIGPAPAKRLWFVSDEERYRPFLSTFSGEHWRPARGLTGLAINAGGPVWAEDLSAVPGFRRAGAAKECGLHTALALPILVGGQGLAVMLCFADHRLPRDESALALAAYIGTQLSHVAERVGAVSRLRDNEARLRAIYENVLDGIVTLNDSGHVESFNHAAERIFGHRAGDVLERSVAILLPEPFASQLAWRLKTGGLGMTGSRREIEGRRADGSVFPMDMALSEMQCDDQRLYVMVLRDVTERRAAERMKDEFISTVSHELRTPLTSISGALILLANGVAGALPDKARDLIAMARKNSGRLVRLINDILDLERLEAGRLAFDLTTVRVSDLLTQAEEDNRAFAEQFGVTLSIASGSADAALHGDPQRLSQVMTNLIANAVKFSPPGAVAEIAASREEGFVRIAVRDQGRGIPEAFRPYVFDKYAQADTSDGRDRGGTGLGLSIAKAIVERHGGRIWFESDLGSGTSFFFEIPAAEAPAPASPQRLAQARP